MENRKFIVIYKDPMCFEPHPLHNEIYGPVELDDDFKQDIAENDVREAIVVNPQGLIISGRRRWTAAIAVGRPEVPIRVEEYESKEKEELALIQYNNQRVKTQRQIINEIERLSSIYEKLGYSRKLSTLKQYQENDTDNAPGHYREEGTKTPEIDTEFKKGLDYLNTLKKDAITENGSSNEKIAEQVGVSPRSVARVKTVINATDDEDPQISEPAKERLEEMKNGNLGFRPAAELTRNDIKAKREGRKPKGQKGRPKGSTSGPISTTGVKTLVQSRLADFNAESKGVEVLREWLIEQAHEKSLEAKKLAIKRGDKKVRESDFRRVLDKPAY